MLIIDAIITRASSKLRTWIRKLEDCKNDDSNTQRKRRSSTESWRHLTPTGLLMEGDFTQNYGLASRIRRERNAPEVLRLLVLLEKLDRVCGDAAHGCQLCHDASRDGSATLIFYDDRRAHLQLAVQLDGCAVLVQVGRRCGQREGKLLVVFTRQPYARVERHAGASALGCLVATCPGCGHQLWTVGLQVSFRGIGVHAECRS
jgi:hypothetical protein